MKKEIGDTIKVHAKLTKKARKKLEKGNQTTAIASMLLDLLMRAAKDDVNIYVRVSDLLKAQYAIRAIFNKLIAEGFDLKKYYA